MMEENRIRRFTARHIVNHTIMLVCFVGLVVTGMPQRYPAQTWAKAVVMLFGGVERVRFLHHWLGTIMSFQLVWHVIELLWLTVVRRVPMHMMPGLPDLRHFLHQIRFNLGFESAPPRMARYGFAEKIEYLALIWGTALMVATGLVLLYPVRFSPMVGGEAILAAKAAHGGEAILAFLSILTWHAYFVHVRHWNKSMFTGYLEEEAYAEEHALELQQIRRGEVPEPAPVRAWRVVAFAVMAVVVVGGTAALLHWLGAMATDIATVSR
jgi:cytochrome b subunit of formate dehydrogenase